MACALTLSLAHGAQARHARNAFDDSPELR